MNDWRLPRYGVRAALRAWATAAVLVGLAWALAQAAAGQDGPPASVPLDGRGWCRVARFEGGAYTAAHCIGRVVVGGVVADTSVDPARDLRHYAALYAPGVGLRQAVVGERLTWRNDRGGGGVVVTGPGDADEPSTFAFCRIDGDFPQFGESGTGLYGADGALVGVLVTLRHTGTEHRIGTVTGAGLAVQVP